MDTFEDKGAWDYIQPWDTALCGPEIANEEARRRWSIAFGIAGGLPYIWNVLARPITDIAYALLELRPGDKVLMIGEGIEPAGWDKDIRRLVGPTGVLDSVEIIHDGREKSIRREKGRGGVIGTWEWTYSKDKPDDYYDCVAVMQATQHCDDWHEQSTELLRVMKPGRRIFFAEAALGGPSFAHRINSDVHLREWYEKAMGAIFRDVSEIAFTGGSDLLKAFEGKAVDARAMEWHGIEMFWARKAG